MNFTHSPFIAMPFSAKPSAQHFPLFQRGKMQCKRAAENEPGFLKLPVSASKASAENMK